MALLFYNLFLFLYGTAIWLVSPWNPKAKRWIEGRKRIFDRLGAAIGETKNSEIIWMHCASLGEFEQGRPVLEDIRKLHPNARILLTFFSASGYEIRKNYPGADYIFYLPMDSLRNAKKLIRIVKPKLVLWVKYEYWYYYLSQLKQQHVPLVLISGIFREKQVFFKWYGGLHRKMLSCFTQIFVQDKASEALLQRINLAGAVTVSGDTRFDRVIEIAEKFSPIPEIERFCGNHQVIVAGSTWDEDEEEMDHFANTHPEIKFIIAPHEIAPQHLSSIKKLFHHCIFFTEWVSQPADASTSQANVLIIDNIGMLSKLYRYATITYIGGGFGESGIHNVLEAAVYGKAVVFGPVYHKFLEARELVEAGAAFSVSDALELEQTFYDLLKSEKEAPKAGRLSKDYVYSKRGAKDKIISYLQQQRLL